MSLRHLHNWKKFTVTPWIFLTAKNAGKDISTKCPNTTVKRFFLNCTVLGFSKYLHILNLVTVCPTQILND